MNKLHYVNAKAVDLDYYDRRFDHDFKAEESTAKRVAALVLPFICLHGGLAKIVNVPLTIMRSVTNFTGAVNAELLSADYFIQSMQVVLCVITVAGTFFSFKIGMLITTLADLCGGLSSMLSHLSKAEYKKALNELFNCVGTVLYFGTMYFASLEIVLASLVVKAISCGLVAVDEYGDEKYPEMIAKIAMGMIRIKGAHTQHELIQRRDYLNSLDRYQALLGQIAKSKGIDPLYDHPLVCLSQKAEEGKVVFSDDEGNTFDLGSYFSEYGGSFVKGMNLSVKNFEDHTELEFKINHAFQRQMIDQVSKLQELQENPSELKEVLALNKSGVQEIQCHSPNMANWKENSRSTHTITTSNGCKVELNLSDWFINSHETIKVSLPKGKSLYDIHQTLSFLNFEGALRASTAEDLERMKVGHLFHTLSPAAAYTIERDPDFYSSSLTSLKARITTLDPSMEEKMHRYLDRMHLKEMVPGKTRFHIDGLVDDLKRPGDIKLTTLVTGGYGAEEERFSRLSSMLQGGMLSLEMKIKANLTKKGLVYDDDLYGANNAVFVQAVTAQESFNDLGYNYSNKDVNIRLLFDPKILESGTYQYRYDTYGNRSHRYFQGSPFTKYQQRDDISTFIDKQYKNPSPSNEIMIKDCIAPEHISGIVVNSEAVKARLIEYMDAHGHVTNGTLYGRDIESFIHVGWDVV